MALTEFNFKSSYNKIDHNIAEDFYLPCMRNAVQYDRITGYFGSAIYLIAWDALKEFVGNNGKMRILCSPFISEEDAQALSDGNEAKSNIVIQRAMLEELERMIASPYLEKPARLLACLISNGTITIKLAIPNENAHPVVRQLFHDKVGIFSDEQGNKVGFRGSLNETFSGLSNSGNIESVDVFQSWDGGKEAERAIEAEYYFERVWAGLTGTTLLYELPQAVKQRLGDMAKDAAWEELLGEIKDEIKKSDKWVAPAKDGKSKALRPHQFAALEAWVANGRRGIFEHATGSGKTFTAICAIRDALIRNKSVIVLVPSIGLLEQWEIELKKAITDIKVDYLICGSKHSVWRRSGLLSAWTAPGTDRKTIAITTMDTACGDTFRSGITQGEHLLVVADEVHRIGSNRRSRFLEVNAGERLGLSATPVRYGDPEGTEAIMCYFGGVVKPVYSLKDAIHDGVLTRYFYYPKEMHLSPTEQEDWNSLTKQINKLYARLMAGSSSGEVNCMSNYRMRSLMLQRARIVKNAAQKITLAGEIILQNYQKGQKWIVYCDNQTQFHVYIRDQLNTLFSVSLYFTVPQGTPLVALRKKKVGINTPNPEAALHVVGSARIEGIVTAQTISANSLSGTLPVSNVSGTLPISKGGTGATTAAGAVTNIVNGQAINPLYIDVGANRYWNSSQFGIHLRNSDMVGLNGLFFGDAVDSSGEGINFYRSSTTWDRLYAYNGVLYFAPNQDINTHPGTRYTVYHSGGATIPISKGGTGATSAAAARTNLGITCTSLYSGTLSGTTSITFNYGSYKAYIIVGAPSSSSSRVATIIPKNVITTSAVSYQFADETNYKAFKLSYSGTTVTLTGSGGNGVIYAVYGMN